MSQFDDDVNGRNRKSPVPPTLSLSDETKLKIRAAIAWQLQLIYYELLLFLSNCVIV
jgi:hypothetical protein